MMADRWSVWSDVNKALREVESLGDEFTNLSKKEVHSGIDTRFWEDRWIGDGLLKNKFPRLYEIERDKACSVKERTLWLDNH